MITSRFHNKKDKCKKKKTLYGPRVNYFHTHKLFLHFIVQILKRCVTCLLSIANFTKCATNLYL